MLKYLFTLSLLLLSLTTEVVAQQAPPADLPLTVKLMQMAPMFVIVFLIFYFLVIKPQNQKLKSHQQLLGELKSGDKVLTTSGILGKVTLIEEQTVSLEVAPNVKIKFDKEYITKKV
ncbi:MAG: preprotein translocase subunit YajC [Candidatus Paceibacterota bacterium]